MTHRFVNELTDHETVDEIYLASNKQFRANRNGSHYLQVQLSDRTGSVTTMLWNANDKIYRSFDNGDFVHVEGAAQLYNGSMQVIANRIVRAESDSVDEADFVTLNQNTIHTLRTRLDEILRGIQDFHLRSLAESFLIDETLMGEFCRAPAGVKIHHAFPGGLLDHVVNLMELVISVAPKYPQINAELLLIGAFLHDIGKTRELQYDRDLTYSDEGQLLGHLVIGVEILDEKIQQSQEFSGEPFPNELALRIKHMILSHHGSYSYGSPRLPMTLEAIALHYLDSLDSKIHSFDQLIRDDVNIDSNWTVYHSNIERKLFKGCG